MNRPSHQAMTKSAATFLTLQVSCSTDATDLLPQDDDEK